MVNLKSVNIVLIVGFMFLFSGCGSQASKGEIVAKVNDYEMTVSDFEEKIEFSPYASNKMPDKKDMLDITVREQVLIQEAQKMGLDRNKTFMKTIERYWQQTLIKELLQQKNVEISTMVPKDERAEALNKWVEDLMNSADIQVYDDVLEKTKVNKN